MRFLPIPFFLIYLSSGLAAGMMDSWFDVAGLLSMNCVLYGTIVALVRKGSHAGQPAIAGWSLRTWVIAPPLAVCVGLALGTFLPEIMASYSPRQ